EIVETDEKNYTISDIKSLIIDSTDSNILNILSNIPEVFVTKAPGVDTVCIYGLNMSTPSKLILKGNNESSDHRIEYSDGDGTVTTQSLKSYTYWSEKADKYFEAVELDKVEHLGILHNSELLNHFFNFINARNQFKK
ncbi:hypothetical protein MXB_960, partial [Myxobolus squamalis]